MLREEGSVTIDASAEKLYHSLLDPGNLPRMLRGNLADVSNVEPLPGGGYRYEWVYRIAGLPIKSSAAMIECVPFERIVVESRGGLKTLSTWVFRQEGAATLATFSIESPIDNPFLRRLSEIFVKNQLRFAVDTALGNLKFLIEQDVARETPTNL